MSKLSNEKVSVRLKILDEIHFQLNEGIYNGSMTFLLNGKSKSFSFQGISIEAVYRACEENLLILEKKNKLAPMFSLKLGDGFTDHSLASIEAEFCARCPRYVAPDFTFDKLDTIPSSPCKRACHALLSTGHRKEILKLFSQKELKSVDSCEWYVYDVESHYCFFLWISMKKNQCPMNLETVAYFLGLSIPFLSSFETKTKLKIKENFKME